MTSNTSRKPVTEASRPGSKPIRYDDLTSDQQHAAEQLFARLHDMAAAPFETSPEAAGSRNRGMDLFLPQIQPARSTRVMLIDGGRGSGKTALLISLLHAWVANARDDERIPDGYDHLVDPERQIVPVGLLDLHPLDESTNLLLHLACRLERVVEAIEDATAEIADGAPATAPWQLSESGELDARRQWRRFLRTAAAGWDANVLERRARLDLESYAIELEQYARQRLDLPSCFAAFMDALVRDYRRWRQMPRDRAPFFVLAIDDADMNPQRSVQLLDVLRMVGHARLAFVLTGDSELFVNTLREHFEGIMRKPQQHLPTLANDTTGPTSAGMAYRLAREVYDKVIPSAHRCRLPPLPYGERFDHPAIPQLRTVLGAIKVDAGSHAPPRPLGSYFEEPRSPLLLALPDRLRALKDLADFAALQLDHARREENPRGVSERAMPLVRQRRLDAAASQVIERIWRDALRTAGGRGSDVSSFKNAVFIDEFTGSLVVDTADPEVEVSPRVVARSPTRALAGDAAVCAALHSIEHIRGIWRDREVDAGLMAALVLAVNVAADQHGGRYAGHTSNRTGFEAQFALACGEYQRSVNATALQFSWPLPLGGSILDLAVLTWRWRRARPDILREEHHAPLVLDEAHLDLMARRYLRVVIDSMHPFAPVEGEDPDSWRSLASQVARLTRLSGLLSNRELSVRRWAIRRAGLLAAPESGLGPAVAGEWLVALREAIGRDRWDEIANGLRHERIERCQTALAQSTGERDPSTTPEEFLAEIDRAEKGHCWASLDDPGSRRAAPRGKSMELRVATAAQLSRALDRAGVGTPLTWYGREALNEAPDALGQVLTAQVENFQGVVGSGPFVLDALWEAAVGFYGRGDLRAHVALRGRALAVKPLPVKFTHGREARAVLATPYGVQVEVLRAPAVTVTDARGEALPAPLDALYRLVWDHATWNDGAIDGDRALTSPWWLAVRVTGDGLPAGFHWPWLRPRAFYTLEGSLGEWGRALHDEALRTLARLPPEVQIDAVAWWLLSDAQRALDVQSSSAPPSRQLYASVGEGQWKDFVLKLAGIAKESSARPAVQQAREWLPRLPLFAAPESGLSLAACRSLLRALTTAGPLDRERLDALRLERLRDAAAPDAPLALQDIDARARALGHPWYDEKP